METKDLRIGNWITWVNPKDPDNALLTATGFVDNRVWIQELTGDKSTADCNINCLRGIPITEDWLFNLGFEGPVYHANGSLSWDHQAVICGLQIIEVNGRWYPSIFSYYELSSGKDQRIYLEEIEYVHELQNLFFVVTGEELTAIFEVTHTKSSAEFLTQSYNFRQHG